MSTYPKKKKKPIHMSNPNSSKNIYSYTQSELYRTFELTSLLKHIVTN